MLGCDFQMSFRARKYLLIVSCVIAFTAVCAFLCVWTMDPGRTLNFVSKLRAQFGDVAGAMGDLDRAIQLDPKDPDLYSARSSLKHQTHDLQGAIKDLDRALSLEPDDSYVLCIRGSYRAESGDQGALDDFDRALSLEPRAYNYWERGLARERYLDDSRGGLDDLNRAIQLDPTDFTFVLSRARTFLQLGDDHRALEDVNKAIKLNPRESNLYFFRAMIWCELGEVSQVKDDLNKSLTLNPNNELARSLRAKIDSKSADLIAAAREDLARRVADSARKERHADAVRYVVEHYGQGNYFHSLTESDLKHGSEQLRKMLADRPEMSKYVHIDDPVWKWTARQFAGEGTGARLFWKNSPPSRGQLSSVAFSADGEGNAGSIQVRAHQSDDQSEGQLEWRCAVFELFNARKRVAFERVDSDALDGKLDRNGYIRRTCQVEFEGLLLTSWFHRTVWLPNMRHTGQRDQPSYWGEDDPGDFADWFAQFKADADYPFQCYGEYYDKLMKWKGSQ